MKNDERIQLMSADPRVTAIVQDPVGFLVHLAPGWLHEGKPFIFGRKLRVIHGTRMPEVTPAPAARPDMNWTLKDLTPPTR